MFEQYDAVKALKEPDLYLIKDCSSGMLAVRKRTRAELFSVYGQHDPCRGAEGRGGASVKNRRRN